MRLLDMPEAAERIEAYARGLDFSAFRADRRTSVAGVRNLEIIGEAAKGIDETTRQRLPPVPFVAMSGMRGAHIHGSHGFHGSHGLDERLVGEATMRVPSEPAHAVRTHLGRTRAARATPPPRSP